MHDEDEAATGLAGELRGEAIDVGDSPGAIKGVGKVLDLVGWLDEAEVEREGLSLIETIDTCHIPRMSETTGEDSTLAWITSNEARLIPYIWQLREEILHGLRLCEITLRLVSQMLQTTLEEDCQCQLMGQRGDMRMLRVAESTRGIVHRTYHIAGEGQRGVMTRSLSCKGGYVVIPLSPIDALCG